MKWNEDTAYEGKGYQKTCTRCNGSFIGNKNRLICKQCAAATKLTLDGQEITPDSLLWWIPMKRIIRANESFAISTEQTQNTHFHWMRLFDTRVHEFYRWPDLRELQEYLDATRSQNSDLYSGTPAEPCARKTGRQD